MIGEQLASRDPRLVVLQYGTNEADDPDLDLDAIARYFDETILRIRAAAPTASILVLGPPDMGAPRGRQGLRSPTAARRRRAGDPASASGTRRPCSPTSSRSSTPQRARNDVAFFDTFAAMGGADLMDGWSSPSPASRTRTTST